MFQFLRAGIRSQVQRCLARRNLVIVPADAPGIGTAFVHKTCQMLGIDLVLDVGANSGMTGNAFRSAGYKGRIISFEPQADVFRQLQGAAHGDSLWECRRTALGDSDATLSMEVSGQSASSSLLSMSQKHIDVWPPSRPVGREEVPVARLDTIAAELGVANHRTLLKLDVQGYEAAVLRGAAATLSLVSAAYVELLFTPLYKGQGEYFEVMATLHSVGLRFAGLYEVYPEPKTGLPVFANGFFVRSER